MPSHATGQHNSEIRRRQLDGEDITAADPSSLHAIPPIDNPASPAEFPATREHFAPPVEGHYRLKDGSWNDAPAEEAEEDLRTDSEREADENAELGRQRLSAPVTTSVLPHEGQPDAKGPLPGDDVEDDDVVGEEAVEEEPEEADAQA